MIWSICMVCGRFLEACASEGAPGGVSHGLCPACLATMRAALPRKA